MARGDPRLRTIVQGPATGDRSDSRKVADNVGNKPDRLDYCLCSGGAARRADFRQAQWASGSTGYYRNLYALFDALVLGWYAADPVFLQ